ncbi:MAG: hypothetical protein ACOYXC_07465, partial [Candidatus Rifleibacteriota bacterium]
MMKTTPRINHKKPEDAHASIFYSLFTVGSQHAALVFREKTVLLRLYLPEEAREHLVSELKQCYPPAKEKNDNPEITRLI